MDSQLALVFIRENLLSIIVVLTTVILMIYYLVERDKGNKLSRKYREGLFEAQSRIFLNATKHLIMGDRDLAIREFLNAVDINKETIETYFALGGLFRSNGEIDKAISIHRSLIARKNINEVVRIRALKELALDFDKGGFVDKAIETYKDVLKVNRDQPDVVRSICRIFEDIGDWDQAFQFRLMLSKVQNEPQSETISHILAQKSHELLIKKEIKSAKETLEDAMSFAPSVSAKIQMLIMDLVDGNIESSKSMLRELIYEHPMYTSFVLISLEDFKKHSSEDEDFTIYRQSLEHIYDFFLEVNDPEKSSESLLLSKVRLLKQKGEVDKAYKLIQPQLEMLKGEDLSNNLYLEYIKILIELEKKDEALERVKLLLGHLNRGISKHFCSHCGYNSDHLFWRCPQCHNWETIQFRLKV